jgi:hypothetical protein
MGRAVAVGVGVAVAVGLAVGVGVAVAVGLVVGVGEAVAAAVDRSTGEGWAFGGVEAAAFGPSLRPQAARVATRKAASVSLNAVVFKRSVHSAGPYAGRAAQW